MSMGTWSGLKRLLSTVGSWGGRLCSGGWLGPSWMGSIAMFVWLAVAVLLGLGVFGIGGGGPQEQGGSFWSSRCLFLPV